MSGHTETTPSPDPRARNPDSHLTHAHPTGPPTGSDHTVAPHPPRPPSPAPRVSRWDKPKYKEWDKKFSEWFYGDTDEPTFPSRTPSPEPPAGTPWWQVPPAPPAAPAAPPVPHLTAPPPAPPAAPGPIPPGIPRLGGATPAPTSGAGSPTAPAPRVKTAPPPREGGGGNHPDPQQGPGAKRAITDLDAPNTTGASSMTKRQCPAGNTTNHTKPVDEETKRKRNARRKELRDQRRNGGDQDDGGAAPPPPRRRDCQARADQGEELCPHCTQAVRRRGCLFKMLREKGEAEARGETYTPKGRPPSKAALATMAAMGFFIEAWPEPQPRHDRAARATAAGETAATAGMAEGTAAAPKARAPQDLGGEGTAATVDHAPPPLGGGEKKGPDAPAPLEPTEGTAAAPKARAPQDLGGEGTAGTAGHVPPPLGGGEKKGPDAPASLEPAEGPTAAATATAPQDLGGDGTAARAPAPRPKSWWNPFGMGRR